MARFGQLGYTSRLEGARDMSEEGAHQDSAAPIAASLAEFTEKLIARRGVEQANVLFGGQIGPATEALSARTNSIGVGDLALFVANGRSADVESGRASCQGEILLSGCGFLSWHLVWLLQHLPPWAAHNSIAAVRRRRCLDRGGAGGRPRFH